MAESSTCPYCNLPLALRVPSRGASGGYWHAATKRVPCEEANLKAVIDALKAFFLWKTVAQKPPTPNKSYEGRYLVNGDVCKGPVHWIPTVPLSSEETIPSTRYPGGWNVEGVTHYRERDNTWPEAQA